MYLSHWKLEQSPFRMAVDPAAAYPSAALDEATARIDYLVAERRRMGVLLGDRGLGKSVVLAAAAHSLQQRGASATVVDAIALSPRELLWRLASDFGAAPDPADDTARLWRRIEDQLAHHRWLGRDTVLLIDDLGQAGVDVMRLLVRLARLDTSPDARWTIIAAAEPTQLNRLDESLLHLIDLRIDLFGWNETDCIGYLQDALVSAGRFEPVFSDDALARLAELCDGSPRHLARLADFALLAGAATGVDTIEAVMVQNAFTEIQWTPAATV